ncbi:hypothetical protein J8J27_23160 [Mycobacterium tuberculosis]|nr:hypothetical protein [Mycobacterium tuberculosis]
MLAVYDSQHSREGEGYADLVRPSLPAQISFAILPGTQRLAGRVEVMLESLP